MKKERAEEARSFNISHLPHACGSLVPTSSVFFPNHHYTGLETRTVTNSGWNPLHTQKRVQTFF